MRSTIVTLTLCAMVAAPAAAQRPPTAIMPGIVQHAQADQSFRVNELEEQVRRLNGKVEELNFLLLELQEKLRRMEEDNELRFQEIEEKRSDSGVSNTDVASSDQGATERLEKPDPSGGATAPADGNTDTPAATEDTKPVPDFSPRSLGTLTFDENGNVVDGDAAPAAPGVEDTALAAAEYGDTPNAVFQKGEQAFDRRDFTTARKILSSFTQAWPDDPRAGKALFRLGEARFWQKDYYEAANAHLEAHKRFPQIDTAADNLLALGLALAGLNQREVACATYAEVLKQYPQSASRLRGRVAAEQASAKC